MPKHIKTPAYFKAGFQRLDETLAEVSHTLAESLPIDAELRELVPWQHPAPLADAVPDGRESAAAQLLSISFEMLNIVEDRVAWQFRARRRAEHGPTAVRGLWPQVIQGFIDAGLGEDDALAALRKIQVEPVLTAHPTEAKRPSVRQKHLSIYETLRTYETARVDPHYGRRILDSLATEFESLWFTGEIFVQRPNINDELQNAISYLRDVFPAVVTRLDRSLEFAWQDAGWDPRRLLEEDAFPQLQLRHLDRRRPRRPPRRHSRSHPAAPLHELRANALRLHRRHLLQHRPIHDHGTAVRPRAGRARGRPTPGSSSSSATPATHSSSAITGNRGGSTSTSCARSSSAPRRTAATPIPTNTRPTSSSPTTR